MTYTITIIGAVGGATIYTDQDILALLHSQQTSLLHGETFTGRPGTQIYVGQDTVLKIRSEIRLDPPSAKRWAIQALEKESLYRIHHPHKTWFIATREPPGVQSVALQSTALPGVQSTALPKTEDNYAIIGNISPRLQALHNLFSQPDISTATRLLYLGQLFDSYFRVASTQKIRLDEGLSNFGVNANDELFYLDDDIYNWDRFVSCAQMLGVYFRSLPWLTVEVASAFGQLVHQKILEHFQDAQYFTVLAEQLRDLYLPSPAQRQAIDGFIHSLTQKPKPKTPVSLETCRYLAILADVHANLPALNVVLNFLKLREIHHGVVLGDIVGYGPHPSQCIERIRDSGLFIIKGNHDHGLAINNFNKGFSSSARWVLEWSHQKISAEQKNWLAELPPLLHTDHWLAVHGAPIDPTFFNAYVYEMTYHDNLSVLKRKQIPICFHGHTHNPGIYATKKFNDEFHPPIEERDLTQFSHALVCPGSVGQPRNRKVGAQFAIYDQQERKIYFHTLMYNLDPLIREMETEGFPKTLIDMLKGESA